MCSKCSTIFDIHNAAFAAAPKSEPQSADQTFQKRNEARKPEAATEERSTVSANKDTGKVSGPQMPQCNRLSLADLHGPDAGSGYRIRQPGSPIGLTGRSFPFSTTQF